QHRPAVLDSRRAVQGLGLAHGDRRQGLPGRRGRRRGGDGSRQGEEADLRNQHGEQRLLHRGAGQRNPVRDQPQPTFRARGEAGTAMRRLVILLRQSLANARGSDLSRNSKPSRDRQGAIASQGAVAPSLITLCLVAAALLSAAPAADDWPQFRGNPQLTGVAAGPVPAMLKLLWTYDAGEAIESSAAIAGGTVYVGAQSKDLL